MDRACVHEFGERVPQGWRGGRGGGLALFCSYCFCPKLFPVRELLGVCTDCTRNKGEEGTEGGLSL